MTRDGGGGEQRWPRGWPTGRVGGRVVDVELGAFDDLATGLPGVRRGTRDGLARWQYAGRLVARQVDAGSVVVRVPLDVRDLLVRQSPEVFSVPRRYAKHMLVVADLSADVDGAVEDALLAAWRLQAGG